MIKEFWEFITAGISSFHERNASDAEADNPDRAEKARSGIPETLAAIKRIAENGVT